MVQSIIDRYRSDDLQKVLRGLRSRVKVGRKYQEKLHASFEERWKLVRSAFPSDCGSVLDIGSNLGAFTVRAAQEGCIALGIEREQNLVHRARAANKGTRGCAFMGANIDLTMCERLPTFDVILLLSVHHHWHHAFGATAAADMLRCVVLKARKLVVFEGPSRSSRYQSDIPNFPDNAEEALLAYYDTYLDQTVGDLTTEIRRIGKAACVGQREPFRWIYALVR